MWMKKQAKKFHHKGDVLRLEKNPFDPHSQDVILCRNTPIICKINNQNLNIVNNLTFTITKIKDEIILIFNEEKELDLEIGMKEYIVLLSIVHKVKHLTKAIPFMTGKK